MLLKRLSNDGKSVLKLNNLQRKIKDQINIKIQNHTYEFENVDCPICDSEDKELIGEKDRYGLFFPTQICTNCGLVFTSPRLNQSSYEEFYNIEYRKLYGGTELPSKAFFNYQKYKGKEIFHFLKKKKIISNKSIQILEVGCGAGGILEVFRLNGHRVKGIDLGREYVEFGKNEFKLDLEVGTLKDLEFVKEPDLIIYSHVIEHILNLKKEIQQIKKIMHKDTLIYIEVPGIKEVHKHYGSDLLKYFQNAHTYHFSLESLQNLMEKNGLELLQGNQYIRSIFRLKEGKKFQITNDYQNAKDYLLKIEKLRRYYFVTPRGIQKVLKKIITKLNSILKHL